MMRVLIVEDSEILRDSFVKCFSDIQTLEVVGWAVDAQTALKLIRELKPDLITLDIQLCESNGYQVLNGLHLCTPKPTVMVLTNYPAPQYRKQFLESGAHYFFDKSNEFDQALGELRRLSQPAAVAGEG